MDFGPSRQINPAVSAASLQSEWDDEEMPHSKRRFANVSGFLVIGFDMYETITWWSLGVNDRPILAVSRRFQHTIWKRDQRSSRRDRLDQRIPRGQW